MRIEQPYFFIFGALLFISALVLTKIISSANIRLHLRAIFLTLGLGFFVIPGHGEIIIGPVVACFMPPVRMQIVILGCVFFFIWWVISFSLLKCLSYPSNGKR